MLVEPTQEDLMRAVIPLGHKKILQSQPLLLQSLLELLHQFHPPQCSIFDVWWVPMVSSSRPLQRRETTRY